MFGGRKTRRSRRCPKGKILRKGYTRKSGVRVSAKCVKDMGMPGKGKKLFTLKKGDLSKYGYHLKGKTASARHKALKKASKQFTKNELIRKLNALSILLKNTNRELAFKAYDDMKYVQKHI
jgi:hypothetical protein